MEKLLEEVKKYKNAVDFSSDAIVLLDKIGRFTFVNEKTLKMTGYRNNELIGKHFKKIIPTKHLPTCINLFQRQIRGLKPTIFGIEIITKKGRSIPVEINGIAIKEEGRVIGVQVIARDMSEYKKIEEKLGETEEIYRTLIESSNDGVTIIQDGNIIFVNKKVSELLDYKKEEIIGRPFQKFLAPEYKELALSRYSSRISGKKTPQIYEIEIINKQGEILTCEVNSSRIIYNGKPAVITYIRDIGERKKIFETVRESEAIFEGVISSLDDFVFILDKDGKFIFGHASPFSNFFIPPEEFLRKKYSEVMPSHVKTLIFEALKKNKMGKMGGFEYWLDKNGNKFWYSAKLSPMFTGGKYNGSVALIRDITKQKVIELELRDSEEKYRSLSNNIPGMVYRAKPDWSTEIVSNSKEICGYTTEELNSKKINWLNIIHLDDKKRVFKEGSILTKKPMTIVQEYRIVAKNGKVRWVVDHKTSFFSEKGVFQGVDGVVFEITERKKIEEELRES
jgi:PAS domain S-box-containing protein